MTYHSWICPECGEKTVQPDWIVDVYCLKDERHKRGRRRKMVRVKL